MHDGSNVHYLRGRKAHSIGGIGECPGSAHLVLSTDSFVSIGAAAVHNAGNAADSTRVRIVPAPLAKGGAAIGHTYLAAASCTSLRSTKACSCGDRVCKPLARSNAWRAWAGWLSACKAIPRPIHQTLLSGAACRAS